MADQDVYTCISGNLIKNGTLVVHNSPLDVFTDYNSVVNNSPDSGVLAFKYDTRFDDTQYYGTIS